MPNLRLEVISPEIDILSNIYVLFTKKPSDELWRKNKSVTLKLEVADNHVGSNQAVSALPLIAKLGLYQGRDLIGRRKGWRGAGRSRRPNSRSASAARSAFR